MNKKLHINIWQAAGALLLVLVAGWAIGSRYPSLNQLGRHTNQPDFNSLESLYETVQRKFDGQIDPTKAVEGAKAGLVSATGDPYTVYLDANQAKELNDSLNGTLSGIGIEIGIKNNHLSVISPIAGSPADRAGLRAMDVIAAVNGEDTGSMTLDQAVSKIRGPKGTQVKLTIVRGSTEPKEITITRDVINVPSVKTEIKPGNIGYLQITQFGSDTDSLVQQAADQFKQAEVKKIVLDLRNDPGGYLDKATAVASQFLHQGTTIVQERRGQAVVDTMKSTGGELEDTKIEVLINVGSASASEILAGALQDNHRAEILGETSFGKGSVQEVMPLAGGAQLKVTVAHWYTPGGRNISKEGIKPDTTVAMSQADSDAGRDPQLDAAMAKLQ